MKGLRMNRLAMNWAPCLACMQELVGAIVRLLYYVGIRFNLATELGCNTCCTLVAESYFSRYVVHRSTANRSVRFFW